METISKNKFQGNISKIAPIFKALGHPARLQIVEILLNKKSCTCGTIVELIPLAQSTISKHLVELKKANLITLEVKGKKTIYRLKDENFNLTKDFLIHHLNENKNDKSLDDFVVSLKNRTIKKQNIKSNPKLKNYNYSFSHVNVKIENKNQ